MAFQTHRMPFRQPFVLFSNKSLGSFRSMSENDEKLQWILKKKTFLFRKKFLWTRKMQFWRSCAKSSPFFQVFFAPIKKTEENLKKSSKKLSSKWSTGYAECFFENHVEIFSCQKRTELLLKVRERSKNLWKTGFPRMVSVDMSNMIFTSPPKHFRRNLLSAQRIKH